MHERVASARVARLATIAPSGRPRLVPITFALSDDTLYSAVDAKPKRHRRLARLSDVEADPRVTVLVDRYDDDWEALWWVRMEGTARVLEEGDEFERALDVLADKYEPYRRERPVGPVLAVDVERWSAWQAGA